MVATCEQYKQSLACARSGGESRSSPLAQAHLLLPSSLLEALEALEGRDCDEVAAAPPQKRCENTSARVFMSLTGFFCNRHTSARRLKH